MLILQNLEQRNRGIIFQKYNFKKLQEKLDEVQKSSIIGIISLDDIEKTLNYVTKVLNKKYNISNGSMYGTTISVDLNAQDFLKTYKYIPESTFFDAVYMMNYWKILRIYRNHTRRGQEQIACNLSKMAKEEMFENIFTLFQIGGKQQ